LVLNQYVNISREKRPRPAKLFWVAVLLTLSACTDAGVAPVRPPPAPPTPPTSQVPAVNAWSNPANWPGGKLPQPGETVTIPADKNIVLDVNPPQLGGLMVTGKLSVDPKLDLNLRAGWIMVHSSSGEFRIGSELQPYTRRATITLTAPGETPIERDADIMGMKMGTKFLGAMDGGQLLLHGENRLSWTRLTATAERGATSLTLDGNVDWRAGDRIVIASSSLDSTQAETRVLTAVSGQTVRFETPLEHRHWGEIQNFPGVSAALDERAEVGLLTRNILVQGDERSEATRFGGHVMMMGAGSNARVSGVEFRHMGQFDRLGRYPFHWHLVGDASGGYIKNSSINESIQRGIVDHGTDNVLVENNVVFNSGGHAFMVENGKEIGSVFRGNLALSARPLRHTLPALVAQNDDFAAAYWIKSARPIFENNVAAGGVRVGFFFDNVSDGAIGEMKFSGNVVHSYSAPKEDGGDPDAIGIWAHGFQGNRREFTLEKTLAYANTTASWADTRNHITFTNAVFADNWHGSIVDVTYRDSIIIGQSRNNFVNPPDYDPLGGTAVTDYNGTTILENVTLVNHTKRPAIRTVACRNEGQRFYTSGIRLVNAKAFALCTGDTVIVDGDGTLTGTGKPTWAVGSDPYIIRKDEGCVWNAGFAAYLCPKAVQPGPLYVQRSPGNIGLSLTRDDGVVFPSTTALGATGFPQWAVTSARSVYTLDKGLETFARMNAYGWAVPGGVELRVPAPDAGFKAYRSTVNDANCYGCGHSWADARLKSAVLNPALNLEAFRASSGATFYFDAAAKMIHVRVAEDQWVHLER
jgi:G8 domain/Right handed beta helix region